MIRLGGPVAFNPSEDPQAWIEQHKLLGYKAAYCPRIALQDAGLIKAIRQAAELSGIVIAEVGAWSNPISPNTEERAAAIGKCQEKLALAEEIGARCCVNIAGSLSDTWSGPHQDHFSPDTFALIVDTVREIIDAVKPSNTFYTLEMMPWALPDSSDSYMELMQAIDRPAFAVHIDPVNMITSPRMVYDTGAVISDLIGKLGPWIQSCHAKDITLQSRLTVHLEETGPGSGSLNYPVYLASLHRLHRDIPLMLEHLSSQEEYRQAADYIRKTAADLEIPM